MPVGAVHVHVERVQLLPGDVLHHRVPGHHALVPPPAVAQELLHAQVAGVPPGVLRRHGGAGRPARVGVEPPAPPPALRHAQGSAHAVRGFLVVALRVAFRQRGDVKARRRPVQRTGNRRSALLPVAGEDVHVARRRVGGGVLRPRGFALAGVGILRAHVLGVPHHVGGELRGARLGQPDVQHRRPFAEQLVDRHPGVRRGVAQQPPRV
mmetsp:Transcript_4810/g.20438  ORF Transcript_4810/g.20438 Transcript_4810/m.20438 type:complete len:209 (-) Transcript_4810:525-1151(-)